MFAVALVVSQRYNFVVSLLANYIEPGQALSYV